MIVWLSPTIISILQNSSSDSSDGASTSYISLMIRSGNYTEPIELGDAEYYFSYTTFIFREINIYAPFNSYSIQNPKIGTSYEKLGLEVKIANVSSDYISDYVVIKVRPITENYMFATYRYTKVDIPLGDTRTVNISSGIIEKTNQYSFRYVVASLSGYGGELAIKTSSQSRQYTAYSGLIVAEAKSDFDIEISVFKVDSNNMVIYVKPLY